MRKNSQGLRRVYRWILPSVLGACAILVNINVSKATHTQGMEMFYRWKNDSSYEFTLIFYRNCQGFTATAPSNIQIQAKSVSKTNIHSFMCQQLATTGPGVPPLQPPNIFSCWPANSACAEEYVYRGTWNSPIRAEDWTFSYELCCINVTNAPNNVQNGALYVECGLNNLDFPDTLHKNISGLYHNRRPNHPGFTTDTIINPPLVSICAGKNVYLDQSVRNYDGDSISYEFIIPKTNGGANNSYINGWTFSNPMPSSSGPISIDSLSGAINFLAGNPTGTGVYMLAVKATEYRKDTTLQNDSMKIIGYVTRNLTIYLSDTTNCPSQNIAFTNNDTSSVAFDSVYYPCPDQTFDIHLTENVQCSSIDTNASCLQLRDPSTNTIIPINSLEGIYCTNAQTTRTLRIHLNNALSVGNYELIVIIGNDGNTLLSECYLEIPPLKDTLHFIVQNQQLGELKGDKLGPGNFDTKIQVECGDNVFDLNFSNPVLCSSIANDGSDFELYNISTSAVIPVTGMNKNCVGSITRAIQLSTSTMNPGNYLLRLKVGSDGNRLFNQCSSEWQSDSILLVSTGLYPNLGKDTAKCEEDSNFQYFLNPGQYFSYSWNTGSTSPSIFVSIPTTYWVRVTNSFGCAATDTMVLTEKKCYTGINGSEKSEIEIFPNPVESNLFIRSEDNLAKDQIEIFNLIGERLDFEFTDAGSHIKLELGNVDKGVYFIKIDKGRRQIITRKFVVNRN